MRAGRDRRRRLLLPALAGERPSRSICRSSAAFRRTGIPSGCRMRGSPRTSSFDRPPPTSRRGAIRCWLPRAEQRHGGERRSLHGDRCPAMGGGRGPVGHGDFFMKKLAGAAGSRPLRADAAATLSPARGGVDTYVPIGIATDDRPHEPLPSLIGPGSSEAEPKKSSSSSRRASASARPISMSWRQKSPSKRR